MTMLQEPITARPVGLRRKIDTETGRVLSRANTPWKCADPEEKVDPIIFDDSARDDQKRDALKLCAQCPVRETCLEVGNSVRGYGIWGGYQLDGGVIVSGAENYLTVPTSEDDPFVDEYEPGDYTADPELLAS